MTLEQAREDLMTLQQKMAAYDHAMGLIYYDGTTTAPAGTAENRARSLSILSEELYRLQTGGETVALLEFLDAHKDELTQAEARMTELLLKDIREMQKIPMGEFVEYQEMLVLADDVW
ncbi:MAG: carboxypeptidase M32, partial [Mogibacterium sp.]|nr:carboxypeptidase M32 [Mogibacterium sp.]